MSGGTALGSGFIRAPSVCDWEVVPMRVTGSMTLGSTVGACIAIGFVFGVCAALGRCGWFYLSRLVLRLK